MIRRWGPLSASILLALVLIHAGTTIPDTDQWLPLLGHRSAVTHSMLLPALVLLRWPMVGGLLAGGFAIHLAADLLSRKWVGYALVKLPLFGALDATASVVFLAVNVLLGMLFYDRAATEAQGRRALWVTLAAAGAVYFLINERYWLLLFPVAAALLLIRRR
ncbi:hypothetical protein EDC65_0736 [Stella humosa]|uniref:Uncharacterized protein n=1 Tax=Stella humosa TaxID=94 RepID=A0A3N1MKN9_9PROT|nr:hypothetical protein [Stella humosa]ROQ01556.1 hypothetical protein EDC65_0736 [Stella humosa]BBK31936.1 hypothetical protein STHU_25700 [Stella humosa]